MIKTEQSQTLELPSWNDMKASMYLNYRQGFLFRGHKEFSWELKSSLERNHENITGKNLDKYYKNAYKKMVESGLFINQDHDTNEGIIAFFCEAVNQPDFKGENYPNLLEKYGNHLNINQKALILIWQMQHHGIYTQLIDFTISFYIATYFALFNDNTKINDSKAHWPCVIAIKNKIDQTKPLQLTIDRMLRNRTVPPYVHERVIKQQAQYIDSLKQPKKYIELKYTINPNWVRDIYKDLRIMNINGYILFGTIEMASLDYYYSVKYHE